MWLQQQIDRYGLAKLIDDLRQALLPQCDTLSARRLHQLSELSARCSAEDPQLDQHPDRLRDFVAHTPMRDPISGDNPVELLTIHASKGLEYDIVILPQLGFSLSGKDHQDSVVTKRPSPELPPEQIVPRPRKHERSLFPQLTAAADQADAIRREEDLCLLYVAITRAKHALECFVPNEMPDARKDGTLKPSWANIIFHALCDESESGNEDSEENLAGRVLCMQGNPQWSTLLDPVSPPDISEQPELSLQIHRGLTPNATAQAKHHLASAKAANR